MIKLGNIKQKLAVVMLGLSIGFGVGAKEPSKESHTLQTVAQQQESIELAQAVNPVVAPRNTAPVTVGLGGNNAWDYVVFGNGPQIYEILGSIKGFLVPDSGDSGFRTLLLFVSIIGVVLLAVQAGFNPIFGFPKLVFFILAAGFISITTFQMRVNLTISDPVRNYYQTVTGVPFIVGAPVAVISSVGVYFTRAVETQLSIPVTFKMIAADQSSGGKFNLFGDLVHEMKSFQFSSSNLKQHISTYMLDCGVHGISRGRITADELMNSSNILGTLEKVATEAVLTKKFERVSGVNGTQYSVPTQEITTCRGSFDEMKASAEAEATALFNATSQQLASSGVNVLAETAMTDLLSALGSNAGGIGGVSTISGRAIALQKGFADYTGKAFADAAQLTGNSELLMAVQVAQQEQAQKTSWAVGVKMFNNIMGYLFTVLQAFILALFPIMIVAFLIPGIGKKLMINMFQLLLWQALWLPGLAIVNYLIYVFSVQEISGYYAGANFGNQTGGFSVNNSGLISEASSSSSLAAQFLGTLIPVITWGLVKGTLAFSEFIGGGIGQSLASSAGSSIAGGNLSQGQISQNQVSANKFNTATSFTSGTMDPTAYMAGAMMANVGKGGQQMTMNGGTSAITQQVQTSVVDSTAMSRDAQNQMKTDASRMSQDTAARTQAAGNSMSGGEKTAYNRALAVADQLMRENSNNIEKAHERNTQIGQTASSSDGKNTEFGATTTVKAALDFAKAMMGTDLEAQANAKASLVRAAKSEASASKGEKASDVDKRAEAYKNAMNINESNNSDLTKAFEKGATSRNEAVLSQATTDSIANSFGQSVGEAHIASVMAAYTTTKTSTYTAHPTMGGDARVNTEAASNPNMGANHDATRAGINAKGEQLVENAAQAAAASDSRFNAYNSNAHQAFENFKKEVAGYQTDVGREQAYVELISQAGKSIVTEGMNAGDARVAGLTTNTDGTANALIQTMHQDGTSAFTIVSRGEDGAWKTVDGKPVTESDGQAIATSAATGGIIALKAGSTLVGKASGAITSFTDDIGNAVGGSAGGSLGKRK